MIPKGFKPNLAATLTKPELIQFPVYCSPKIDGIRCVVFDGVAYSRSLKPIPSSGVQAWAKEYGRNLEGFDGELVVGSSTASDCMQRSMAAMRKDFVGDFTFYVFDLIDDDSTLEKFGPRYGRLLEWMEVPPGNAQAVPQKLVHDMAHFDLWESMFLKDGYEGMMIRRPDSLYKFGRSTERSGGLTKVKRFSDAEATVIGFEEEMHNANEPTKDALGRTERSSVASGLAGKGTLGALRCVTPEGIEFNIGTGFSAIQRHEFWRIRSTLLRSLVTYKYFAHGVKEAPRHPVWKGFRHHDDL